MRAKRKSARAQGQAGLFPPRAVKMPEGYYSGDQPNPNLRAFVEAHVRERRYDPETDDYDVPAFNKPIQTTKATAIYNMHTYWSKKPHDAIRQYIRHYTQPGDLVLDPMCGSGGTALAALMEGRKAIAIDRSPAAIFITKNYCTPVDVDRLQESFEEVRRRVKPEMDWLYETRCDRCGGKATTVYTVYSQVFRCPHCMEKVPLHDCIAAQKQDSKGKAREVRACPHCYASDVVEEVTTRGDRVGVVPVMVSYLCEGGCKPARGERRHNDASDVKRRHFEEYDLGKLREIEGKEIPYWYPRDRMMHAPLGQLRWGMLWRPYHRGIDNVCDFYSKRNLWAMAALKSVIPQCGDLSDVLEFNLTSIALKTSLMMAHNSDGIGRIQKGVLYIPAIIHDVNVLRFWRESAADMLGGFDEMSVRLPEVCISCEDSRSLEIASASIDYIFTDPPYSWKVQFAELNFIWEAWLGLDTHWHDEEIIVNEVRGKMEAEWAEMMRQAMAECYRVLKPGRWLSLCYHDTSEGTWALIQDIMAEAGFMVDKSDSALFIDTQQKSIKQITADKVTRRDLVINFRKPRAGEVRGGVTIGGDEDRSTFNEKARAIIRDYVELHPGTTKDRIYDELVSRMVQSGRMESFDFDSLLRQVCDEIKEPVKKNLFENRDPDLFGGHEIGRWYLRESALDIVDQAETDKEDLAAEAVGSFMSRYLREHPGQEGVHYSDIFECYVYSVKDKPRRPLSEWLADYFFATEGGTYRSPDSEEERAAKAEGRAQGTSRRIKRYLAHVEQGVPIPERERPGDATLADWIRHCKRSGMYEQGKLLYEKGGLKLDNLSEEMCASAEEDYQVCTRLLARQGKP